MPELLISPEKVGFLIEKAREFDVKEEVSDPDSGSNGADDDMIDVLEDNGSDPVVREITGFINALTEDEQVDLVALMRLGLRRLDRGMEGSAPRGPRRPQRPHRRISFGRADAGRFSGRGARRIWPVLERRANHADPVAPIISARSRQ